jgi:hypothetical protein
VTILASWLLSISLVTSLSSVTRSGTIWWASESFGPSYLALPIGPGHTVRLCGPAGCLVMRSTDAGPALFRQREGRIADLAVDKFEQICGVSRRFGSCPGSWTVVDPIQLPSTDTEPVAP